MVRDEYGGMGGQVQAWDGTYGGGASALVSSHVLASVRHDFSDAIIGMVWINESEFGVHSTPRDIFTVFGFVVALDPDLVEPGLLHA